MTIKEAIRQVLRDERKPLNCSDIAKKIEEAGYHEFDTKSPPKSVASIFSRDRARGDESEFVRPSRGMYTLRELVEPSLAVNTLETRPKSERLLLTESTRTERQNQRVRESLRDRLMSISPDNLEEITSQLLSKMGFKDVKVTKKSGGDKGIDVECTFVIGEVIYVNLGVQVKQIKKKEQPEKKQPKIARRIVQQLRGSLNKYDQGLIVTNNEFSRYAEEEAENKKRIALIDREKLLDLLMEHNLGVEKTHEIDETFWNSLEK